MLKKLLLLLLILLFVSCTKDEDGGGLDDPNKPLSEKLAEVTSEKEWFFEVMNASRKSYNVRYHMQDGYVINYRGYTDDNGGYGVNCIGSKFWRDHPLNEITILNDEANAFTWSSGGMTFSLVYDGVSLTYRRIDCNGCGVGDTGLYSTATLITQEQLNDYLNKVENYPPCN